MPGSSTILVVEDDPDIQSLLRSLLERRGYTVLTANTAVQAKAVLATRIQQIDLVLLDIGLEHEESGIDLVGELRLQEAWKRVPIVAVTSQSFSRGGASLIEHGFTAFLAKPFNHQHLLSTVELLLARR
ncbi:MAG: hypothetical protein QOD06_2935 [Candidatus Binatota bacterium]|nr:hypothetical protein [Candidatus Binatota bacterium]